MKCIKKAQEFFKNTDQIVTSITKVYATSCDGFCLKKLQYEYNIDLVV